MNPSHDHLITLAIETSCDDTSVAVLRGQTVISNLVSSQINRRFGGIVPELAARAHQAGILPVLRSALDEAHLAKKDINLIAVTYGPGLIGSLLVGLNVAKGLAFGLKKPLIGVNHIEAHILASFLEKETPTLPVVALVVSGGHTLLVLVKAIGDYQLLGSTVDDAAGECFDKVARLLGLQPAEDSMMGGPLIDQLAKHGNASKFTFPRPLLKDRNLNFSFSGLKTSVMNFLKPRSSNEIENDLSDICAGFQEAVVDVLVEKSIRACLDYGVSELVITGGVAANSRLRVRMKERSDREGIKLFVPSPAWCTDNAAMIGITGWLKYKKGVISTMELSPQPALQW
ncbi:tRNA (adenosine(37)-N6)-threonylcarbamoyltransferase complex transferase subunit TsaD [bacterium]|nr:tRNA (adenosine(37)-N6)-threonylcarbamoyltransferase complex transferase subunit TsaD [bacterium]